MKNNECRGCFSKNLEILIDLGESPISNAFLKSREQFSLEQSYPLCVFVCMDCGFTQLPSTSSREVHFNENYAYFSSYSSSWLAHSRNYVDQILQRDLLSQNDLVLEIASNDGYLLQYFKDAGVKVLGVEPSENVARMAVSKGIPTEIQFMGLSTAKSLMENHGKAKLILGNNVLAHVPDIHDFIGGVELILADDGLITFEFPHLVQLLISAQFDTIYHEHYSYLSLTALNPIFAKFNLVVTEVHYLSTHGGSLRLELRKATSKYSVSKSVQDCLDLEATVNVRKDSVRSRFREEVRKIVSELFSEIIKLANEGKTVAGFGAAAKGNTLLNYAGISSENIAYIVDSNPTKQNTFAPGSHIPVVGLDYMTSNPADVFLVLPWNLAEEIATVIRTRTGVATEVLRAIPSLKYI